MNIGINYNEVENKCFLNMSDRLLSLKLLAVDRKDFYNNFNEDNETIK